MKSRYYANWVSFETEHTVYVEQSGFRFSCSTNLVQYALYRGLSYGCGAGIAIGDKIIFPFLQMNGKMILPAEKVSMD